MVFLWSYSSRAIEGTRPLRLPGQEQFGVGKNAPGLDLRGARRYHSADVTARRCRRGWKLRVMLGGPHPKTSLREVERTL